MTQAVVSPRSIDPPRRRATDVAILAASCVLLVLLAMRAPPLTGPEVELAGLVNPLLRGVEGVELALRFGSLWVVAVIAGVGVLAHRRRLSLELIIAGVVAWSLGRALALWYGEHRPPPGIVVSGGGLQEFPVVRVAVAVAVVAAAAPYLTRLIRRAAWALIAVMSIGAVSLGTGLPSAVLAGLLVGWAAAAGVHLLFGSPAGRPSLGQIADALEDAGVDATDIHLAPVQGAGSTRVLARAADGADLFVSAYGRDEQGAQLLSKLWRFVWYEDSGPTLYVTRLQQVEHQAYAMLLAAQAGVPVPKVVAATAAGRATAVLVEQRPPGSPASELDAARLSDQVLDAGWHAVVGLREARVAHHDLDLTKLFVADEQPVLLVDFGLAGTSASDGQLDADAARMLAATSVAVGRERAVAAARRALGDDGLVAVLPYLQSPVLTDAVRRSLRRGALAELRATAAATVGAEPPPLVQLERVRPRSIAFALLTFVGVYALLGHLGNFGQLANELRHAHSGWILVAVSLWTATNIAYAMAYVGATTARVPFGRTIELQVAGSFTNLIAPNGLGTAAINARFLQVRGVPVPAALASVFLNTVGSAVAELLLFVAVLPAAQGQIDLSLIPWRGALAAIIAVGLIAAVASAVVWHIPRARRFIASHTRPALGHFSDVLHSPSKLCLLIGGQALVQILYALTLDATCFAFGTSVPLTTLLLLNIASSTVSGLVPAPGGLGVAEATLAGALTATGVPAATAISIALTYRLITTWLPAMPGWIALRALERGDDL